MREQWKQLSLATLHAYAALLALAALVVHAVAAEYHIDKFRNS